MPLTLDNLQLSEVKNEASDGHPNWHRARERNANSEIAPAELSKVRGYVIDSVAENSRRAYASDLEHFRTWGGEIPSTPIAVSSYLASLADTYSFATIKRRLAAISRAHALVRAENPCGDELVRRTIKGIARTRETGQRQARPLLRNDLFALLDTLDGSPKGLRDRALLLVGFATALRRSELVALDVKDIEEVERGMLLTIRRSKTDQEGRGRRVAVPFGRTRHCPVIALRDWLEAANIFSGPIFRPVSRHGRVGSARLSAEAVSQVLKQRAEGAGYTGEEFSGHSLRAGFATSAALAGAPSFKIRQTTGHRSDASLARYTREADLFDDPAVGRLI